MATRKKVDSPKRFTLGSGERKVLFVERPELYAIHGWKTNEETAAGVPVLVLEDTAVFRRDSRNERYDPVYEVQPGGTPAVPTGRVFVRFASSVNATARRNQIRSAGYHIVQELPYAPQAAWVEANSGDVQDSLRNLDKLKKLDDVENVEPQMLMPAARR
jgi:hypothetical protein